MRKSVIVSGGALLSIVLLICGGYMAIHYGNLWGRYADPFDFEHITADTLMENRFVVCDVDEYMGKMDGAVFTGCHAKETTPGDYEYIYTLPMNDGKYIELVVTDFETHNLLEGYYFGMGNTVKVEGMIVKSKGIDKDWYSGFNLNVEDVVDTFVIRKMSNTAIKNYCIAGIFMVIFSFIIFFRGFKVSRIRDIDDEDEEDDEEAKKRRKKNQYAQRYRRR